MFIHLRNRAEHHEKCTEHSCMSRCGFQQLTTALNAPLLRSDFHADARAAAVLRGDI